MNVILQHITGSRAYGTARSSSDTDMRAIVMPTDNELYGFCSAPSRAQQSNPAGVDYVAWDIRKFFRMAAGGAFNALELLYIEAQPVIETRAAHQLRAIRDMFLSQQLVSTALGIAQSARSKPDDLKHSMHAVRCLRMAHEACTVKRIHVERPDAEHLNAIRYGAASPGLDDEVARVLAVRDKLPPQPNYDDLNHFCRQLVYNRDTGLRP